MIEIQRLRSLMFARGDGVALDGASICQEVFGALVVGENRLKTGTWRAHGDKVARGLPGRWTQAPMRIEESPDGCLPMCSVSMSLGAHLGQVELASRLVVH